MSYNCRQFSLVQRVIRLLGKINLLSLQEAGCPSNQGDPNSGDLCAHTCPTTDNLYDLWGVIQGQNPPSFFIQFTFSDLWFWLAHQVNRADILEAWQLACVILALIKDLVQSIGKQRVSVTKGLHFRTELVAVLERRNTGHGLWDSSPSPLPSDCRPQSGQG